MIIHNDLLEIRAFYVLVKEC